jgi:hypothetical protein
MSMKLTTVNLNRGPDNKVHTVHCALANGKGDFINVQVKLETHHDIEQMTFAQFENLAIEAAKKLHP